MKRKLHNPNRQKVDRKTPENYRDINLLNLCFKLSMAILHTNLKERIKIAEKQQGFRQNRSTIDAIFILR